MSREGFGQMDVNIDLEQFQAFFFDFDGVIVDSVDVKTKAFGELFRGYGEEVSKMAVEYHYNNSGVSRYEKFRYLYEHLLRKDITEQIIDDLDKEYSRLVVDEVVNSPFIEGAFEFIVAIYDKKKDCFVISATPQEEMRRIIKLKNIEHLFKDVVGSPKSKAENLKLLLDRYRISSRQAVYFGDAYADYRAAQENHMQFIGIVDKSRELANLGDIMKIKNFCDIIK